MTKPKDPNHTMTRSEAGRIAANAKAAKRQAAAPAADRPALPDALDCPFSLTTDPDTGRAAIRRGSGGGVPPSPWEIELMRLLDAAYQRNANLRARLAAQAVQP